MTALPKKAQGRPTFAKILNKRLVQLQERFVRGERVFGQPFQLVLETGNVCNLRCPLCPTPHREGRIPSRMLSYDNARRIIDQFPYLCHVNLSLWGEPLLNREIFEIIAYARAKSGEVFMQSNLNLFGEEAAERLVASGLDCLQVSLDGASQETYEKYRVRGTFETVIGNMKLLDEVKARARSERPVVIWKMVVNRFNEHEIPKAKAWATELGAEFRVVEIYTPPQLAGEWKPRAFAERGDHVHTDMVPRCYSLWQTVTVNFNGDLFPCCSEFSPRDVLGNVLSEPFGKIWNGEPYRRLRRNNRRGINCEICHADKETNWYRLWMGDEAKQARGVSGDSAGGGSI